MDTSKGVIIMSTTNWISSPSIDIIKLYRAKKDEAENG